MLALLLIGTGTGASAQTAEVTTKDVPFTFKADTTVIPVPVVVRDAAGHAIVNLTISDFQLFDNGKPQIISKFAVEKLADRQEAANAPRAAAPVEKPAADTGLPPAPAASAEVADRFVAYLFDDVHMSLVDLVRTREAAGRQIDAPGHARERAAIFTTSGRVTQEFSADPAKLHAALNAIGANQATAAKAIQQNSCPRVDYYMADRIYNQHDLGAWKVASNDALACAAGMDPGNAASQIQEATISGCEISGSTDGPCRAVKAAKESARDALAAGDRDTESALAALRAVVNRMTAAPGQRSVVLISPGFLVLTDKHDEMSRVIDAAIRASVVIGGLDARGLYSQIQGGDASERVANPTNMVAKTPFQSLATLAQTDSVANIALGTGGTFSHAANDFDAGIAQAAAVPDCLYVLSFSPQDLKLDGRFHDLKVTLKPAVRGADIQARKGYYAASYAVGPAEQSKQQIEEAFFSRQEVRDLPAILQTQYFKGDNGEATLSAVAKIDVKKLAFKKDGGRNRNDVTVVTGVFDSDGNYVSGSQKVLELRLLDQTLETRVGSGISVRQNFTVHSGRYLVRLVVRDSEGATMSAQSSLVEIP